MECYEFMAGAHVVECEQAKASAEVAKARLAEAELRRAQIGAVVTQLQPWSVAFCGGIVGGFLAGVVVFAASAVYYFSTK